MQNGIMMQYFEWELANDGKHWERLKNEAKHLSEIGVTSIWFPPCFKAMNQDDVGYGVYDLYDLGEFDQKGTTRTKYGTKEELLAAIEELHKYGIRAYADVVLNHKAGADATETFPAVQVDEQDRNQDISDEHEIESWTKFTFPGRAGTYSDFHWHWYHFTGVSEDVKTGKSGVYRIVGEGKRWAADGEVSDEFGNYDYLMFANVDYHHPEVIEETKAWIKWFIEETGIDGIRLDAVKHIHASFMGELVDYVRAEFGEDFFFVAEYWDQDPEALNHYLAQHGYDIHLMDVRFHYGLHEASVNPDEYDLCQLFDGTLYRDNPLHAVTFVDNHDSQPGQSLESFIEPWFKPIAYGIILLSDYGYPCVYYPDYYGYQNIEYEGHRDCLECLMYARKEYAYGEMKKYLDDSRCIGFTRAGTPEHPCGCAVVISSGDENAKQMSVGEHHAGEVYTDLVGHREEKITIEEDGTAVFPVNGGSISVWVPEARQQSTLA